MLVVNKVCPNNIWTICKFKKDLSINKLIIYNRDKSIDCQYELTNEYNSYFRGRNEMYIQCCIVENKINIIKEVEDIF